MANNHDITKIRWGVTLIYRVWGGGGGQEGWRMRSSERNITKEYQYDPLKVIRC